MKLIVVNEEINFDVDIFLDAVNKEGVCLACGYGGGTEIRESNLW